ncbi:MAG: hypothetical protein K9L64_06425, partial [Candidatus Izimaplasma sp.]|nr:hypothetical protein [Candidatus Izimaplasma bacterium]
TTEEATTEETTTEEATTEQNNETDQFFFRDGDDHLATKGIEGILIYGETTYNIEGKFLNVEGKEIVRLRSYIDEDNFVVVNYQNDTNGDKEHEKFFFKLVEEGITINQSKVRVFEKENMTHVQLEMTEGESYSRYLFQIRERDGISYIHINYEIDTPDTSEKGNIHLTKEIDPETGDPIYNYSVTPGNANNENASNHSKRHGRQNNENTTKRTA